MTTDPSDQLEIELRQLERDKRIEEIRQLKARGRAQWITPAAAEAGYALGHIEGLGPAPDAAALAALRQQMDNLPLEVAETLGQTLERHGLAVEMIGISERILAAFGDTLELVPVSGWAAALEYMPSGSIAAGRNVMISQTRRGDDHSRRYYDVDEGRFLLESEVQAE
jgi:hypothetical protein